MSASFEPEGSWMPILWAGGFNLPFFSKSKQISVEHILKTMGTKKKGDSVIFFFSFLEFLTWCDFRHPNIWFWEQKKGTFLIMFSWMYPFGHARFSLLTLRGQDCFRNIEVYMLSFLRGHLKNVPYFSNIGSTVEIHSDEKHYKV